MNEQTEIKLPNNGPLDHAVMIVVCYIHISYRDVPISKNPLFVAGFEDGIRPHPMCENPKVAIPWMRRTQRLGGAREYLRIEWPEVTRVYDLKYSDLQYGDHQKLRHERLQSSLEFAQLSADGLHVDVLYRTRAGKLWLSAVWPAEIDVCCGENKMAGMLMTGATAKNNELILALNPEMRSGERP